MVRRVVLALVLLAGIASPALAQRSGDDALRAVAQHGAPGGDQAYPVVELVTMGVGSLIWERHGHIALCVVYQDPAQDTCFNYGVADFTHPLDMTLGFFRGTHSFWADRMDPNNMLAIYAYADRTIWVQPLPLTPDQKQKMIDRLEHDILPENRYYAYDHFWDNCTTRIRDIIDDVTGGALRGMVEPSDGKTYRDLAREGFIGMPSNSRVSLLITDIAMGRVTDRVPSYYERMFLPQFLREAVAKRFAVQPIPIYTRRECVANPANNCTERGVDVPDDGPSGRVWFALVILALTAPAWATRKWGRFQRTGMALALIPQVLLGLVLWVLAIISPLPYVHWNETCLVLIPLDLCLLFLRPAWRRKYARARVVELGLCAALLAIGVLRQPLWEVLLWPLIPAAVVGFWPERDQT